ncbi:Hint domain-containing protein [Rhodobacter lacus]|uniref:Hint domain-containing protein n=1 Tax=Rhodobacter lacus TaxID=1641972 RepID=A0ABW5ABJ9_9RHOB
MVGDHKIFAAYGGADAARAGASSAGDVIETRLHCVGFDTASGHVEGRDGAGNSLFTAQVAQILGALPCFTAETWLATGAGLVQIGALTPGMRVITRDDGMQELRWIGRRSFGWQALGLNPLLRPVRIAAGALGPGVPERDMVVSPNHRFLTRGSEAGEAGERLSMARELLGKPGITLAAVTHVEYWQLLFDRHQLVLSDSCWSESFQPTPASLAAIEDPGRAGLDAVLGDAAGLTGYDTVRPCAEIDTAA